VDKTIIVTGWDNCPFFGEETGLCEAANDDNTTCGYQVGECPLLDGSKVVVSLAPVWQCAQHEFSERKRVQERKKEILTFRSRFVKFFKDEIFPPFRGGGA